MGGTPWIRGANYGFEKRTEDANHSFYSFMAHILLFIRKGVLVILQAQDVHSHLGNFVHIILLEIPSLTPFQSYHFFQTNSLGFKRKLAFHLAVTCLLIECLVLLYVPIRSAPSIL